MVWRKRPWIACLRKRKKSFAQPLAEGEAEATKADDVLFRNRRRTAAEKREELDTYIRIVESRDEPLDVDSYQHILKLCIRFREIAAGLKVQAHIAKHRMEAERFVGNNLVFMHAEFGNPGEARRIFDNLGTQNVYSFIGIIRAYVLAGDPDEALKLFHVARLKAIQAEPSMLALAVEAAGMKVDLPLGLKLHDIVRLNKMEMDQAVVVALIGMYSKCRELQAAVGVFERARSLGRVLVWNACVAAFAENGDYMRALRVFRSMILEGLPLNASSYMLALESCRAPGDLQTGCMIHRCVVESGAVKYQGLVAELIRMLGMRLGWPEGSVQLFESLNANNKSIRCWAAYIEVLVKNMLFDKALQAFEWLLQTEESIPREIFLAVLGVAGLDARLCKKIHVFAVWNGVELEGEFLEKLVKAYESTKPGRDGAKALLSVHKRVVRFVERSMAARDYKFSFFDFQD